MSGMGGPEHMGPELPTLAFVFALLLIGYSIWDLDQLSGPGPSGHYSLATARRRRPAPCWQAPRPGRGRAGVPPPSGLRPVAAARRRATWAWPGQPGAAGAGGPADGGTGCSPRGCTSCRIAMGVTMAFMLLIMI